MVLRELNPATDALLLFRWRCDPVTVKSSFSGDIPTWDNHLRWLLKQDPQRTFIACVQGDAVGCVRFTPDLDRGFEVHIVVAPEHRGQGYGAEMLRCALEILPKDVGRVAGYIRAENEASRRTFTKAGFKETYVVAEWERPRGALGDLTLA